MKYQINETGKRIHVNGSSEEISNIIRTLDEIIAGTSSPSSEIIELTNNINSINEFKQYNFNSVFRVEFKNNSLIYGPNCRSELVDSAFKKIKETFEETIKKLKY